jgi:tetratricopeptide (TPR) repeat protein
MAKKRPKSKNQAVTPTVAPKQTPPSTIAPKQAPPPAGRMKETHLRILISLALVMATAAVFWQVRTHEFVNYDDNDYITENYMVKRGLTWGGVVWAFSGGHANNWHPLTWMAHMLDCQLFGLNSGAHHLVNAGFHVANTVLLFFLLQAIAGGLWRSAFVAALFGLHPLHVQSVAWASERKDTLSTLLWFLIMWAYAAYARRTSTAKYALVLGLYALGLMAKPMLVTIPLVLLLMDYWPLGRLRFHAKKGQGVPLSRLIWEKAPMFVMTVLSSIITFLAQLKETVVSTAQLPLYERTTNAIVAYSHYVIQLFWPGKLAMLYPISLQIPWWKIVGSLAFLATTTYLVLRYGTRHRYLVFGWFWYVITLIPVIGFVQVGSQAVADRYTYIPYIGLFMILAWGAGDLVHRLHIRRLFLLPPALAVLCVCAVYAHEQVGYWKNSEVLLRHTLEVTPDNCLVHNNYAITMDQKGNIDEAIKHYLEALRIKPDFPEVHNNLGAAYDKTGKHDEAFQQYLEALRLKPEYPDALYNTAASYRMRGKIDEAIEYYKKVLQLRPDYVGANFDLGGILFSRNQYAESIAHYEAALDVIPNYPEGHNNLACVLVAAGKKDEAIAHLRRALQLKPNYPDAYKNLAVIFRKDGRIGEALENYRAAIQAAPDRLDLANDLAWLLATSPDASTRNGNEALSIAERCNQATGGKSEVVLDTLGAAYAAVGRYEDAVKSAQQAVDICKSKGALQQAKDLEARLQLYKAGKPYVLAPQ